MPNEKKPRLRMTKLIISNKEFDTLVAVSEEEQLQGLMYKKAPAPIMIFPYNKKEVRKFWMRNAPAPLDIIFCSDNTIIDIIPGVPFSLELVGPSNPCDLVVEVPSGFVKENGVKIGSQINIKYNIKILSKLFERDFNIKTS